LQDEALNASPDWHRPFQPGGTAGMSVSLKLGDSGQIPESNNPLSIPFIIKIKVLYCFFGIITGFSLNLKTLTGDE